MSLTEILTEVVKLSLDEKEQVLNMLKQSEEMERDKTVDERQAELFRRLQTKGMLKKIPVRRPTPGDFEPVPIQGRPLSETIIEDRR